jgi:uncharacterized protein YbaA (DUF1428 family)
MAYVDGFVFTVPTKRMDDFRKLAKKASKVWKDHGAIEYRECVGDDMNIKGTLPFPKLCRSKPSETIMFSFIVYKSRAHRDRVNAKVMKDPRMAGMDPATMPFDCKRMAYGGFKVLVSA